MSLTSRLVKQVWAKAVSESDLRAASFFVLDALASAVGAQRTEPGRIFLEWWAERGQNVASETFTLAGLIHILEMDDLHRESVTHPGCVVIPAAWATATRHGKSGAEFLTAVLRGYEVMARIGAAVGPAHYKIWHNTATCGPFGSAAATSALLGLTEERVVWALGNAGTQASGLWEFIEEGALTKHLHAARAAEAGLSAAELARRGLTGPTRILEGGRGFFRAMCPDGNPKRVLGRPDDPWELTRTSIKPWPSCRHTHPTIDAALALRTEESAAGSWGELAESVVRVETYGEALALCDRPTPTSAYEAKFSLQFCVAAALKHGEVGLTSFDEEPRAAHAADGVAVTVAVDPGLQAAYPDQWGARVTLHRPGREPTVSERRACL
ncbi:MAG: MmgE/PrpD family protein, partial [Longimicrobiales bacterium]